MYDSYQISAAEWATVLSAKQEHSARSIRGTPHDAVVIGLLVQQAELASIASSECPLCFSPVVGIVCVCCLCVKENEHSALHAWWCLLVHQADLAVIASSESPFIYPCIFSCF